MASNYRVAVIGRTGRGDYGHGIDIVWKDVDNATIVAVADEDEKGRGEAAKRLDVKNLYADYRQMLEKERPQIVSICPRFLDCHRDMLAACAEYGCHVFMEKPMARTLEEADEMVAICERKHIKLALAHQTRYSPRIRHAEAIIKEGKIGDILELRGRGKEDFRGGGEDLMVLGSHIMDLMRLFCGDPSSCYARVLQEGKPVTREQVREGGDALGPIAGDELHAMYAFRSPVMGYFSSIRAKDGVTKRFGLRIYGSKGVITMNTGTYPEVYFTEDPAWAPGQSKAEWIPVTSAGLGKPEPDKDAGAHAGNLLIVNDLIRAIETDSQPRESVYDGRASLEMILGVYESHRLRKSVDLPLENRNHPLMLI